MLLLFQDELNLDVMFREDSDESIVLEEDKPKRKKAKAIQEKEKKISEVCYIYFVQGCSYVVFH